MVPTYEEVTSLVKEYAKKGTASEMIEYVVELLMDLFNEVNIQSANQCSIEISILETLETSMVIRTSDIKTLCQKLIDIIIPKVEISMEDESDEMKERKKLIERFSTGKHGVAVLEEDGEWHMIRIIKLLDSIDSIDSQVIKLLVEFIEFGKMQEMSSSDIVLDDDQVTDDTEDIGLCAMCEQHVKLTQHHLTPRVTHAKYLKKGYTREFLNTCIAICRPCHSHIHSTEDNKTLAKDYNTLEKILQHPRIIRWLKYAKKRKIRVKVQ